jgi:Protein of unknown function (DUF938)
MHDVTMRPNSPHRYSPASERNRVPLLAELAQRLAPSGVALEIASGTGQHAAYFAPALPGWQWWPTDADPQALPSIAAWCAGLPSVAAPVHLDVMAARWAGVPAQVDLIFNANMLHISPWPTCEALMRGAAQHLRVNGQLMAYGPFWVEGQSPAPSNLAFDADLKARNPQWGLRSLVDVQREAAVVGLVMMECVHMPANNLLLVWKREAASVAA